MKLVLKLPENKPPFIGILLLPGDNRSYPERLNESLIMEHKYADYRLELELSKNKLNLLLISDKSRILKRYDELDYQGGKLAYWIYKTASAKAFNFGHVIMEKNKEMIVRTWAKKIPFVLKIGKYNLSYLPAST